jgi:hypothetical protein
MGLLSKLLVFFVGLSAVGLGLWFLGIVCFAYILYSPRPKKGGPAQPRRPGLGLSPRLLLASALLLLSAVAYSSGGTFSPLVLLSSSALLFLWPRLSLTPLLSRASPSDGSILLRSAPVPFLWHCVAEVKPGADDLARALSSFDGRLVFLRGGPVYAWVTVFALGRGGAEDRAVSILRDSASSILPGGAYLLPLEGRASAEAFKLRLVASPRPDPFALPPDVLVLEASGGFVRKTGSYRVAGPSAHASLPSPTRSLERGPLLWEALEALGKKRRWPDPDPYSNLLESLQAAKGEPIGERLAGLEGSGQTLKVKALGGDTVSLSPPQLRALAAVYS